MLPVNSTSGTPPLGQTDTRRSCSHCSSCRRRFRRPFPVGVGCALGCCCGHGRTLVRNEYRRRTLHSRPRASVRHAESHDTTIDASAVETSASRAACSVRRTGDNCGCCLCLSRCHDLGRPDRAVIFPDESLALSLGDDSIPVTRDGGDSPRGARRTAECELSVRRRHRSATAPPRHSTPPSRCPTRP